MLRAALTAAIDQPDEPAGSTPRERIRWALDQAWYQVAEVLGRRGAASAIVASSDPRFTDLFRSVLDPYNDARGDLIRSDMAAGELRHDLDPDMVVSLLVGAYLWGSAAPSDVTGTRGLRTV